MNPRISSPEVRARARRWRLGPPPAGGGRTTSPGPSRRRVLARPTGDVSMIGFNAKAQRRKRPELTWARRRVRLGPQYLLLPPRTSRFDIECAKRLRPSPLGVHRFRSPGDCAPPTVSPGDTTAADHSMEHCNSRLRAPGYPCCLWRGHEESKSVLGSRACVHHAASGLVWWLGHKCPVRGRRDRIGRRGRRLGRERRHGWRRAEVQSERDHLRGRLRQPQDRSSQLRRVRDHLHHERGL